MTSECITDEKMAALVEGRITDKEQNNLFSHIIGCTKCYDQYLSLYELETYIGAPKEEENDLSKVIPMYTIEGTADDSQTLDDLPMWQSHYMPFAAKSDHGANHHIHNFENEHDLHETTDNTWGTHAVNSFGEHASHSTSEYVHQIYPDTCSIKAQQLILKDFGIQLTEEQLREEATEKGWYIPSSFLHPGGTYPQDVGRLLEAHGIPIYKTYGGNVFSLVNELAQGHEVIVDVDANSLWHPGILEKVKDVTIGDTPNHSLIVAGINATDPQNITVILKDPGTGDIGKEYSLKHFMDAWKDSNYLMVSTSVPMPHLKNFDYHKGHIEHIGHHNFEEFQALHANEIGFHEINPDQPSMNQGHGTHHLGPSAVINKVVDFFDLHVNHHHPDHTEVNNVDHHANHEHDHFDNDSHDDH